MANGPVKDLIILAKNFYEVYNEFDATRAICQFCHLAWQKNLMPGWSGNASVRLKNEVWITAKGTPKGFISPGDCMLMDPDGCVLKGSGRPSSESALHLALYKSMPDCLAILHTHPGAMQAVEIADSTRALPEILGELPLYEAEMWLKVLYFTPRILPGSLSLAEAAAQCLAPGAGLPCAVWLSGHGLVACGKNLLECLCLTEEMEHLAKVVLAASGRKTLSV